MRVEIVYLPAKRETIIEIRVTDLERMTQHTPEFHRELGRVLADALLELHTKPQRERKGRPIIVGD